MENEHSNSAPVSAVQASLSAEAQAVLHNWQELERLGRFFGKLLGEITFVGADKVEFKLDGESMSGVISKGGKPFKTLSVKALWMEPMHRWLSARSCPVFSQSAWEPGSHTHFVSTVRTGETLISCRVDRTGQVGKIRTLNLSNFKVTGWGNCLELLSVLPTTKAPLEELFNRTAGSLVVVTPAGIDNHDTVATALSFTNAVCIGDASEEAVRAAATSLGTGELVVMTLTAEDPSEALLKLRGYGAMLEVLRIAGVVSCAFARRVCPSCAKRAQVDPVIMGEFPPYFQKMSLDKYVGGRGCELCGHSGYHGMLGLQSVLRVTESVSKAFAEGTGHAELVSALYSKGLRPLYEDGIRKALEGLTTFEAVTKVARSAPQAYFELWKLRDDSAQESESTHTAGPAMIPPGSDAPLFARVGPKTKKERPTVLVVEDDPDQRSILEMVLKGAEYDVKQAGNGEEALERIQSEKPDLIVCDLMMPKMDGSELVSRLKGDPKFSRIPILMLTMIADEEKEYALLDLGADDYCDKTIQRKILLKRIENLMKRAVE